MPNFDELPATNEAYERIKKLERCITAAEEKYVKISFSSIGTCILD